MTLLWMFACEAPPLLDSVTAELGARTVSQAEDGVRLFVAGASLVAETCGVEDVAAHVFEGAGAEILGVTTVERVEGAQTPTWVFADVGLDGDTGEIHLSTDDAREDYTVSWQGGGDSFAATVSMAWCDVAVPEAVVSGSAHHVAEADSRTLDLNGPSPYPGLRFRPVTALPSSGYVTWVWPGTDGREGTTDDRVLTLDDASTLTEGDTTWGGTASGSAWSHPVELAFP